MQPGSKETQIKQMASYTHSLLEYNSSLDELDSVMKILFSGSAEQIFFSVLRYFFFFPDDLQTSIW